MLESPVEDRLRGVELRSDWKRKQWPAYLEAIARIQDHGITVNGCFVIGLDGDGPEVFDKVFSFVEATGLYEVQVTVLTAFPGAPLYDRLKREKRIIEDRRWDKCTLFDVNFKPSRMSADELASGFRGLVVRLYSEEFTSRRRASFVKRLRQVTREKEVVGHER
jgi:radical SAM superfamily enzyme YgiQ (UPF0313 family)